MFATVLGSMLLVVREPPLEYCGVEFFRNIFVGKMGELNKWPQGMFEI